ncbi:MAG: pyridoxamine 5'-phosphate oxidase family protein [Marinosulfonomonas sp.]|nr:pyridoxamine 5'-phosphate oxidase family protein [Marinosulfonomonas sp.]
MKHIQSLEALHELYGTAGEPSLRKVASKLTPQYREWILRSRYCVLSTVGPEGTDATPRGDDGPVVAELDDSTLAMPDWRGNNRLDSLRNIVRDPRASLLFMVAGSKNVIRVNGRASITADAGLRARFEHKGIQPSSVIVLNIQEIYFQCARALLRSGLWSDGDQSEGLPTPGQILAAMTDGAVGGTTYDHEWPERAKKSMW